MTAPFVMWHASAAAAPAAAAADAAGAAVRQGGTQHFNVFYDPSLGEGGAQLAAAVLLTAEVDYTWVREIFGLGGAFSIGDPAAYLPFNIYLVPGMNGAVHGPPDWGDIYVDAFYVNDPDFMRLLVVAEVVEVFAVVQDAGWWPGASNGEALSRVLATELYPSKLGMYATAPAWLADKSRPDWLTRSEQTDVDSIATGCGTLFLNFLRYQLGFTWEQIVRYGAPTLAQTYQNLPGGGTSAYVALTAALDRDFPVGVPVGLTSDNPFPMGGCAAITSEPGRLDVFTRYNGEIAHLRYPGPDGFEVAGTYSTAWEDYPAAVSWAPQRADVFARNQAGHLAHWWSGDDMMHFAAPEVLGNWFLISAPTAVSSTEGRLDVFALGAGQTLLHWRYPGTAAGGPFSAGQVMPGGYQVFSPPAAVATAVRIDVFAVGADAGLLHWWSQDDGITFSGPETLPGNDNPETPGSPRLSLYQPAAVAGPDFEMDVFARDRYGTIWRWSYRPEPSGPGPYVSAVVGGQVDGHLTAALWPPGDPSGNSGLHLFGKSPGGGLSHWWTGPGAGQFYPPEGLGGLLLSPPAATTWAAGRLDVFGEAPDHSICHWWYDTGGWGLEGLPA